MDDLVTLTRDEYERLVSAAEPWRALLRSPHVVDLLAEWREWLARRDMSESTAAMASLVNWRAVGVTYAELERRRRVYDRPALTPEQIRARAVESWAAYQHQGAAA